MNARRHLAVVAALLLLTTCSQERDADDTLAPIPTDSADSGPSSVTGTAATVPPTSAAPSTAPPTSVTPSTAAPTTSQPPPTTAAPTVPPPTVPPLTTPLPTTPPPTPTPPTTPPTPPPPPTAPPSTEPAASAIVLRSNGIADIDFGADPDSAIATVQAALGNPSDDSGWVDPFTISACPGTEYRRVSWGALSLQFSDATSAAEGRRHFFGYEYGLVGQTDAEPAGLTTPEGIGIGSTVADLRQAYPDVGVAPGEEGVSSPAFEVTEGGLAGLLTDAFDDGIVMVLVGGDFCGG